VTAAAAGLLHPASSAARAIRARRARAGRSRISTPRILRIFQITGLTKAFAAPRSVADAITADPHWRHTAESGLLMAGAATMLLASHALASGPLAASQPGFTILDPLTASLLGVFLFGEHIRTDAASLAGEVLALAVVIAGATALSRSCLILGENQHPACLDQPTVGRATDTPDREPAAVGRP